MGQHPPDCCETFDAFTSGDIRSRLVGSVPARQGWLWFRPATNRDAEIDPIHAPVLMFSRNGYVREAALKAVNQVPDAPFFLAALVWRLNDWVEPVRRAAEGCAKRQLPRCSTRTVVGAAPFLLGTFGADGFAACSPARNACTD
jgi:hypothetical protein